MEARERLRKSCFVTSLSCKKIYNNFLLVNPFADSFLNSDWLELVIYFQTNEQGGEQNALLVNFSDNSDLRRGFQGKFARLLG